MQKAYYQKPSDRFVIETMSRSLALTKGDLRLVSSIYKEENGGFDLKVTNNPSDPGGLTVSGMTLKNNPEIAEWDTLNEYEQYLLLIRVYKKYLRKVDESIDYRMRFLISHALFVGFDTVISKIQECLVLFGLPVTVDGVYGHQTEGALMSCDSDQIESILSEIAAQKRDLARKEAEQVMSYQKRNNLPIQNYTTGYSNRMSVALEAFTSNYA
jgi:lysozyme family protein